jgi:hypothetical protein
MKICKLFDSLPVKLSGQEKLAGASTTDGELRMADGRQVGAVGRILPAVHHHLSF